MLRPRLMWTVALASLLAVAAVAMPVSGYLLGHGPFAPSGGDRAGHSGDWSGNSSAGYAVTFSETGLPVGTEWAVRLVPSWSSNGSSVGPNAPAVTAWHRGLSNSSTNATIGFSLPNGSYRYSVPDASNASNVFAATPDSGTIVVNGSTVSVAVSFAQVAFYTVSFVETGLPSGTFWSVSLGGFGPTPVTWNASPGAVAPSWFGHGRNGSTGPTVNFTVPDGNYTFSIRNVSVASGLYVPTPSFGNVSVKGSAVTVDVTFAQLPYYLVSFVETGLPAGTNWSVVLFGGFGGHGGGWASPECGLSQYNSSNTTTVNFTLPNGTYEFLIGNASTSTDLYVPSPSFGNVSVNGSAVTVNVAFAKVAVYTVTFAETGLPSGTNWSVILENGSFWSWSWNASSSSTVNFTLTNGSYNFSVGNVTNGTAVYVPTPANGTVTVNGADVTVGVSFAPVALYTLSFTETGLPAGTFWSVGLFNGTTGFLWNGSTNASVNFSVPNGTYGFAVLGGCNGSVLYVPSPANGTVTVSGASVTVAVTFTAVELTNVTFVESGLPTGTNWYVGLHADGVGWAFNQSNNSTISVYVPNGSYAYSVGPVWANGTFYTASPSFGEVTVSGTSITVDVTFSADPSSGGHHGSAARA